MLNLRDDKNMKKKDLEIVLDNAQSGGPQIQIIKNDIIVGTIYPRAEPESMIYWSFDKEMQSLDKMSKKDNITLYEC